MYQQKYQRNVRKNIKDISREKGGKSRPANEKYYAKHLGNIKEIISMEISRTILKKM